MEKYNLVVETINQAGDPDSYGNTYYWIGFAGGVTGLFGCKEQDLFTIGQPSEFYIEKKVGKSGKEYSKILRVSAVENPYENNQKKSHGGSGSMTKGESLTAEDKAQINRSVAIKAVCELRSNTNITIDEVLKQADQVFDYIQFGVNDEPKTGHEKALEPVTDELPWE